MKRIAVVVMAVAACTGGGRAGDSAFKAVQARGDTVMGVNQYTSAHVFEDAPDGGRIILDRDDGADTAAVRVIREHMRAIVVDFRAGNFARPFAVHARDVPGTDVMRDRYSRIQYAASDRPRGAEVRITTSDSLARDAIHRFLAFQRMDHRAAGHDH